LVHFTKVGYAQNEKSISGIVSSAEDKFPVIGAIIKIKSLNQQTITDNSGKFSLRLNSNSATTLVLEISSLGFETKISKVEVSKMSTILLDVDQKELKEVIITSSYGTKKRKEDLVGSIVNLKAADLQVKQSVESFDKMLEGLAAVSYTHLTLPTT
jgi:hypothetical protein